MICIIMYMYYNIISKPLTDLLDLGNDKIRFVGYSFRKEN